MVISCDHGNKSIKTPNFVFTSGLIESAGLPGIKSDYIFYDGKYYCLTEKRISYLRDKTEDDRFFILTLFAIAFELQQYGIMGGPNTIDITLLVGLPPAHYGQLHEKFENYFKRDTISFDFNGRNYNIRIIKVFSYTQALAAAVTKYGDIKEHAISYVIDIGGFTVDVLKLRNGRPDLEVMESFEQGVITLFNSIRSKCNAQFGWLLDDSDIEEVIKSDSSLLPSEVQEQIRSMAEQFLGDFFNFLRECGIDTKISKCIFAGGGALLLRNIIDKSGKVGYPIYIDNIHANAVGYKLLYKSEVKNIGR